MHFTAESAVAKGAAWLDKTYPGWVDNINLGTLSVASCDRCVLGQVWTNHIPENEQDQILAQVKASYRSDFSLTMQAGFGILARLHEGSLVSTVDIAAHGFAESTCYDMTCPAMHGECLPTYEQLTDAWTKLIIRRRLDAYPDLVWIEPEKVTA